jgi:hypothetical protein
LEYYQAKSQPKVDNAVNVVSLIESLKASRSNADVLTVINDIGTTNELKKLSREKKLDTHLGKILVHMRNCFTHDLDYPKKIDSADAFSYEKLMQLPKPHGASSSEYSARLSSSSDFIQFTAHAVGSALNNTKLRISVTKENVAAAWDLIKEDLISPDSPIWHFKIINMEKSALALAEFKKKYQECIDVEAKDFSSEYLEKQIKEHHRLIEGGQITLYLPSEITADVSVRIAEFLQKITGKLIEHGISPGVMPESDRSLAAYISGRVGGTEWQYVLPTDTSQNSTDAVLNKFADLLTPEPTNRI